MQKFTFSYYKFFAIIIALFFIDQIAKYSARFFLEQGQKIVLIPYFIDLFYIENTGISWGLLAGLSEKMQFWLLSVLPLVLVFLMLLYILKNWHRILTFQKIGWAMILGGAFGNLYDRFLFQSVTDFMHFHFFSTSFFVNNFADDFISIGLFLIIWKDIRIFFTHNQKT